MRISPDDIVASVVVGLAATFFSWIFGLALKSIQKRIDTSSSRKQEAGILRVADHQISELTAGRIVSIGERKEAIDFLRYDVKQQLANLESARLTWHNNEPAPLLSRRASWILGIACGGFNFVGSLLYWPFTWAVVLSVLGIEFLIEVGRVAIWGVQGWRLDRRLIFVYKQAHQAMLAMGPTLHLDLSDLLTEMYSRARSKNLEAVQGELRALGLEVELKEIRRAIVSCFLRAKSKEERRELASKNGLLFQMTSARTWVYCS